MGAAKVHMALGKQDEAAFLAACMEQLGELRTRTSPATAWRGFAGGGSRGSGCGEA